LSVREIHDAILIYIVPNMVVTDLGDMKQTQKLICIGAEINMGSYLT